MRKILTKCRVIPMAGGVALSSKKVTVKIRVNFSKMKMKFFKWMM
jgi:hypothetical protein